MFSPIYVTHRRRPMLRPHPIALISVTEKKGIVEFALALIALGFRILASGGTAKRLEEGGVNVIDISTIVGPPILDHRVATLSREMHAALLARIPEDEQAMAELGYQFVDLVCVDFYRLEDAIKKPDVTLDSVIKDTDIGGPALARSGAKGNRIVICVPEDREPVLRWLQEGMPNPDKFINALAARAEFVVSQYCLTSAAYRGNGEYAGFAGKKVTECCYGENYCQSPASLFTTGTPDTLALDAFELILGNPPSFINLTDIDRLIQTMTHIAAGFHRNQGAVPYIAVGCKHGNPCGAGVGQFPLTAATNAVAGDPLALFGGFVMANFDITGEIAQALIADSDGKKRVLDGVVAPSFEQDAQEILQRRNGRCRLFRNDALRSLAKESLDTKPRFVQVRGGFLVQENYSYVIDLADPELECTEPMIDKVKRDILLAWAVGSTSNSNTITLVKDGTVIGNAVGQQDRMGAAALATRLAQRAGHNTQLSVAYSDSFFPFTDGPQILAQAGIRAILATSGSVKDDEVRDYCIGNNVALYRIPDKKGRGFFRH